MPSNVHQLDARATSPRVWIDIRQVYGNTTIYPVCEAAKRFADIAGTRTLTANTLRNIAALGYDLAVESGGAGAQQEILRRFMA